MRSACFQIYGQPEPPPDLLPLRAGPLTLLYDPGSGMVRRIKLGKREVLRGIYAAVRDRDWGTVPPNIQETRREIGAESFQIEFTATHQHAETDFIWRGRIVGTAAGELRYDFAGEARSSFLRNRIGFCVLHPIAECAGARARQTRVDGRTLECRFPEEIEPQIFGKSSFQQLRAVAHEVAPDCWAEVSFEGDTFEMEDQRNWTDASFKTYCTPLSLPFPVKVNAGDCIQQVVKVKLLGRPPEPEPLSAVETMDSPTTATVEFQLPATPIRLPKLGLGLASEGQTLTHEEITALRSLELAHLRVDVRLGAPDATATLRRAAHEAASLGVSLELAIHLPRRGEGLAEAVRREIESLHVPVARILALREGEAATTPATLECVRLHFGWLKSPIGAGSDCNFCELNREQALGRLAIDGADFLFWSINPQVHATDHLSVMEALEAQAATVRSAAAFAGGLPLVISPITLKQRFNPVATAGPASQRAEDLPPQVDPRQLSQFAAAWTFGSAAALTGAGVSSVTYYETAGWRGVMEHPRGPKLPHKFPAAAGQLFPVFHTLAEFAGRTSAALPCPLDLQSLPTLRLLAEQQPARTVVANLTANSRTVRVKPSSAGHSTVTLRPYQVFRLSPDS